MTTRLGLLDRWMQSFRSEFSVRSDRVERSNPETGITWVAELDEAVASHTSDLAVASQMNLYRRDH